jgi:TonB family protein
MMRNLAIAVLVFVAHVALYIFVYFLPFPHSREPRISQPVTVRFGSGTASRPQFGVPPSDLNLRKGTVETSGQVKGMDRKKVPGKSQAKRTEKKVSNSGKIATSSVQSSVRIPEQFAASPDAPSQPAPDPADLGPSAISSKLKNLLPNSNMNYASNQKNVGQGENGGLESGDDLDYGTPVSVSTTEYKYTAYFDGFLRQLKDVWSYPAEAARAGMQGEAVYDIVLNRDGTVRKVIRVRTSGYEPLDKEVERAVVAAGPYNPVPSRIEKDPLVIRIRFIYTLKYFGIF